MTTVIICGMKKDHECNEDAVVYETRDGKRHYFKDGNSAHEWYEENYRDTLMGTVTCSICFDTAFDNAYKLGI